MDFSHFFKMYTTYINGHESATKLLNTLLNDAKVHWASLSLSPLSPSFFPFLHLFVFVVDWSYPVHGGSIMVNCIHLCRFCTLLAWCLQYEKFRQFYQTVSSAPPCSGLDLNSYLIMPIQRMFVIICWLIGLVYIVGLLLLFAEANACVCCIVVVLATNSCCKRYCDTQTKATLTLKIYTKH